MLSKDRKWVDQSFDFGVGRISGKKRVSSFFFLFFFQSVISGCTWLLSQSSSYDRRPMTVQTLNFYNQRLKGRLSEKQWKGDWIIRRHRLALIDYDLRSLKPDIFVIQQLMQRVGNPSESDRSILTVGALIDYEWEEKTFKEYSDTEEKESSAIAISPSLKFVQEHQRGKVWPLGDQGFLHHSVIFYEDQMIDIFNVQLEIPKNEEDLWIQFIDEKLSKRAEESDFCKKRLILAGFIPVSDLSENFQKLLAKYELKDTATGFCMEENRCYTATPTNEVFLATRGDENPSRSDRIYVNQASFVYSSRRNFMNADSSDEYAKEFGLQALWPSQRFGWGAQLRLPRCSN